MAACPRPHLRTPAFTVSALVGGCHILKLNAMMLAWAWQECLRMCALSKSACAHVHVRTSILAQAQSTPHEKAEEARARRTPAEERGAAAQGGQCVGEALHRHRRVWARQLAASHRMEQSADRTTAIVRTIFKMV